ncbi:MAG: cyclic nucleotide-binding domain-containing protein [Coriobacteriia bacterium]
MKRQAAGILTFESGEKIYQQGDLGAVMHIIQSGRVKVVREDSHGEMLLAVLGPGEFFGEMSLLSGGRRSATVYAETTVELEVITRSAFSEHIQDPLALQVMRGLTDRLRRVDSLLEYLHVEQFRVRQDAHDRVYNRLGALSRLVEVAGMRQADHPIKREDLDDFHISLPDVATDIRDTVTALQHILSDRSSIDQSPSVDHAGVFARIEGVCTSQADTWQMDVDFTCEGQLPELTQSMCWDLECIVEEALTNAAKHGEAGTVRVAIEVLGESGDGSQVALRIVDNGNGFPRIPDLSELPDHSKGLRSMHSRAQSYGGHLEMESCSDCTTVSVLIPISVN